jgi:hypothetical protein
MLLLLLVHVCHMLLGQDVFVLLLLQLHTQLKSPQESQGVILVKTVVTALVDDMLVNVVAAQVGMFVEAVAAIGRMTCKVGHPHG